MLLALAAGVLAAVNPCGFALLPAYLSLLVVGDAPAACGVAVGRALAFTAAMTAGFVAVFGAFGLVLAPVAGLVQQHLPWFTIGFGLLLAALGGWLVAGRQLPALPWKVSRAPVLTRSALSMTLFGAAYALASLSCTIGPFLAIVGSSVRAGSILAGIGLFVAYAVGMGLVVGVLALAVALARASLVRRLRAVAAVLSRAGGVLLLVTGGYVAYYGRYELRATGPGGAPDGIVRAGTALQHEIAAGLERVGVVGIALAFAALLAGWAVVGWAAARRASR
ncbi:cytochrome c biogenesis protein CcdA [Planosporangium thailandense]|uniref:Cytochrome c biogenesis protein CcdA n=1 Tax=Planosporangium thailandense TaxID=765197 RepID=A0ABX0Y708_9ACTN|nr:cytochrome c biogenesis protein CcdA [Planosporangium thailandense]NJC74205.1 cytochrome c biogenesis protein CcdA [Planosporangium thailandense]